MTKTRNPHRAKDGRVTVANRTVLAKTCTKCGCLKQGADYAGRTVRGSWVLMSECQRCTYRRHQKSDKVRRTLKARTRALMRLKRVHRWEYELYFRQDRDALEQGLPRPQGPAEVQVSRAFAVLAPELRLNDSHRELVRKALTTAFDPRGGRR